ncbi:MAG: hydroxypyruvate isomerase family protein [Magnetovibrio sp.]|nr:hydroxypyruvate isomerase family protein [Magnetovibrio sp.]
MPKFAANLTMMFSEVDFLERFARAAQSGFKGVEYLFPYAWEADELAQQLRSNSLEQALFNMPPGDWDAGERGLACLPGRESELEEGVAKAIGYAKTLGCQNIHMMAGLIPAGLSDEAAQECYLTNLRSAADMLNAEGLTLLIEPINSRDMPGYFLNTTGQAKRLIEMSGRDNIKLQFDFYHCQISEGDLATRLKDLYPITAHYQIAGVPERHEPSIGEINYPDLFARIDALDYQGWIGCEYRPKGKTEDGLSWFEPYCVR